MSTAIATINVNFTSNFVGCHRLFWRRGSVGAYTGPVEATPPCTGNGNPCTISFFDVVDTEGCEPITYEGYVQACCEDIDSATGRIPFTATYTPTPTCFPFTITCATTEVAGLEIVNGGSGYDGSEVITLVGGGYSSLAQFLVIVGTGEPTNLLLTDPGSGPNVAGNTYTGIIPLSIVGSGTAITLDIDVINTGAPAFITTVNAVTITSSSADWDVGDYFTIDPADIGNVGTLVSPVTITVGATDEGTVIGANTVTNGAGYTSTPIVNIQPPNGTPIPGGSQAVLVALMAPCPDAWTVGEGCTNSNYSAYPITPAFQQQFTVCFNDPAGITSGTLPTEYSALPSPSDCCATCVKIQVQNLSPTDSVDVAWVDCNAYSLNFKDFNSDTIAASGTLTICCVVDNSWALSRSTDVLVTVLSSTCDCTPIP